MTEAIPAESTVRVVAETDQWAIVELMGHVKHAGRLTEEERFGSKIGRLDIPDGEGYRTMFFGGGGVYRVQVVSEAVARHVAKQTAGYLPVSPWDFPEQQAALPASSTEAHASVETDDEDDADFDDDESDDIEF